MEPDYSSEDLLSEELSEELFLDDLPAEMHNRYAGFLPAESIGRMSQVNTYYNELMNTNTVWKNLYDRDIAFYINSPENYKSAYIEDYPNFEDLLQLCDSYQYSSLNIEHNEIKRKFGYGVLEDLNNDTRYIGFVEHILALIIGQSLENYYVLDRPSFYFVDNEFKNLKNKHMLLLITKRGKNMMVVRDFNTVHLLKNGFKGHHQRDISKIHELNRIIFYSNFKLYSIARIKLKGFFDKYLQDFLAQL